MDKTTHARLLRAAMAEKGLDRQALADATGKGERTVTNWRSGTTMPSDRELIALRKVLGPYDEGVAGSDVESAIRRSELIKWRQDAVISFYERNLYEQQQHEEGQVPG